MRQACLKNELAPGTEARVVDVDAKEMIRCVPRENLYQNGVVSDTVTRTRRSRCAGA
jgi:hypothetical protein